MTEMQPLHAHVERETPVVPALKTLPPSVDLQSLTAPSCTTLETRSNETARDAYEKIFEKSFTERASGESRAYFHLESDAVAATFGITPTELYSQARAELRTGWEKATIDVNGHIENPEAIGEKFTALYNILKKKLDFWILTSTQQLNLLAGDLSPSLRQEMAKVIECGEAVMLTLAQEPPQKIAQEIREIGEKQLHGIMNLWTNDQLRESLVMSPELRNYLEQGTVKVRTTSDDPRLKQIVASINHDLEKENSFEDMHWLRVVKGIAHSEKQESLKDALKVCIPIVVAIKVTETFAPHAMHIAGGVLDDIFGAILPDVSQSMGQKEKPFMERMKHALPVLLGGAASIPFSFAFAWGASSLYQASAPLSMRLLAGGMFAFACCAGTLGTSIAAFRKSWNGIGEAQEDPKVSTALGELSFFQKAKLALRESIFDVPFRVGHTAIGVPVQIGLGLAAGAFGFFNSGLFVMVEGMAETILGAAAAYVYPHYVEAKKLHQLSQVKIGKGRASEGTF